MNVKQIEVELARVSDRLIELRRQIGEQEQWEAELHTTLRVLTRLGDASEAIASDDTEEGNGQHTIVRVTTVKDKDGSVHRKTYQRTPPPATGVSARAGKALMEMLRLKGNFIRPKDAVARLKTEHNISIGIGKPGRETSDLSSAIGNGRVPGLIVTRQDGWGLEEWQGVPPIERHGDHP